MRWMFLLEGSICRNQRHLVCLVDIGWHRLISHKKSQHPSRFQHSKDPVDKFTIARNYKNHLDAVASDRALEAYLEAWVYVDSSPDQFSCYFTMPGLQPFGWQRYTMHPCWCFGCSRSTCYKAFASFLLFFAPEFQLVGFVPFCLRMAWTKANGQCHGWGMGCWPNPCKRWIVPGSSWRVHGHTGSPSAYMS